MIRLSTEFCASGFTARKSLDFSFFGSQSCSVRDGLYESKHRAMQPEVHLSSFTWVVASIQQEYIVDPGPDDSSESLGCLVGCFLLLLLLGLLLLLLGLPGLPLLLLLTAALMLAPVPCALKSTDLLCGCCCYVFPAVG